MRRGLDNSGIYDLEKQVKYEFNYLICEYMVRNDVKA